MVHVRVDAMLIASSWETIFTARNGVSYGNKIIADLHVANFRATGFSTDIWHVYRPGSNFSRGTENVTGTAFDFAFSPCVICSGAVSNAFVLPRKKLTLATMNWVAFVFG